ncbi:hypothetical protein [Phenylobacterium sp.]|uniref:hypothetical protein n=1 Tax=Phenylobacterium sp. TaxID=1871053 RepID=UPI002DF02A29|nr:hypothetical protein [Phenylobacterium sp.]
MSRRTGIEVAVGAVLLLSACATAPKTPAPVQALAAAPAPPAAVPREVVVKVPVKTACVPKTLPPPPKYPDSETALRDAGGAADRYQLLAAGRILRSRRLALLERVIEGCR